MSDYGEYIYKESLQVKILSCNNYIIRRMEKKMIDIPMLQVKALPGIFKYVHSIIIIIVIHLA